MKNKQIRPEEVMVTTPKEIAIITREKVIIHDHVRSYIFLYMKLLI